jgi:hypothetical protein
MCGLTPRITYGQSGIIATVAVQHRHTSKSLWVSFGFQSAPTFPQMLFVASNTSDWRHSSSMIGKMSHSIHLIVLSSVVALAAILRLLTKQGLPRFICGRGHPRAKQEAARSATMRNLLLNNAHCVVGDRHALESIQRVVDQKLLDLQFAEAVECSKEATRYLLDLAVSRLTELKLAGSKTLRRRGVFPGDFDPEQGFYHHGIATRSVAKADLNALKEELGTSSSPCVAKHYAGQPGEVFVPAPYLQRNVSSPSIWKLPAFARKYIPHAMQGHSNGH